ncbi:MAG: PAS domain-containing protein [Pseudomonadota bacterium]
MAKQRPITGVELTVDPKRLVVSKTDLTGKIVYANDYFRALSGYSRSELIGAPHSILRHPDMPRIVFKRMWDQISQTKREIFAYVVNRAANGDHYWVVAHVTPSFGPTGTLSGYHSNRRAVDRDVVRDVIEPLYAEIQAAEKAAGARAAELDAGQDALTGFLDGQGVDYDEFVVRLATGRWVDGKAA